MRYRVAAVVLIALSVLVLLAQPLDLVVCQRRVGPATLSLYGDPALEYPMVCAVLPFGIAVAAIGVIVGTGYLLLRRHSTV